MNVADAVRADLESRLGAQVDHVDPGLAAPLGDRLDVTPALADVLAPLVGVLRRERRAA
jgi:hypothetical protein